MQICVPLKMRYEFIGLNKNLNEGREEREREREIERVLIANPAAREPPQKHRAFFS